MNTHTKISVDVQAQKALALAYMNAFDRAQPDALIDILSRFTVSDYAWRGMHPFYEKSSAAAVAEDFWIPLRQSFMQMQRRQDIFFGGCSDCAEAPEIWTCSMGHFIGLFDDDWLAIPATGKLTFIPYAEFHRIEGEKIVETALFIDILSVMAQAGQHPLPPQTGAFIIQPGPLHHDGLLFDAQPEAQGQKTLDLCEAMALRLDSLNKQDIDNCEPEFLAKDWAKDMLWYGPTGIGATYTIERYQRQHQQPFRRNLSGKIFNGHIARFAEGNYCGWFGWPNLYNTNKGGFLGMPSGDTVAEMRVVDIYRRDGDKLAENWVFIDILHYLSVQGLDVLKRMADLNRKDYG
ncbi:MAG: nuclear transport factor 2 family protein [Pseudomonadota bacterium]